MKYMHNMLHLELYLKNQTWFISTLYHYYDSYAKIQTYIACLSSFLLGSFSSTFCLLL